MSFNRGFRQGDNRMNSYQPNNQRPMQRMSNISPWEGGVVPNARPSNSQSLLALPTSQLQQNASSNLISAQQLALASSLLSSLGMNVLPNQQQQQQRISQLQFQQAQLRNDNLPALLRMSAMGNSQPSFNQQGQRNVKFNNVPGDRFRNVDTMRNRMHQNMTNNRIEPYLKNRPQQSPLHQQQQQRRTFVNKPRVDRKPTASLNKPGTGAVPEAARQAPKFRKPVKVAESTDSTPMEQEVESKTVDEAVKEAQIVPFDGDLAKSANRDIEEEDTKRDWKDEKNDVGIEKVVDPCAAVEEVPVNSIVVASEEPIVKDVNEGAKKKGAFLLCHICDVSVDNVKMLQEHTKLESHKTLMEKTSASYQAQAAALRLNMQETFGRIDSTNRNNRHDQHREFCKMCKLNFVGSITSHRKLKEHLQLKTFLHPRCLPCSKEFTTRIEWDAHRLTPAHQLQEQAILVKAEAKAVAGSGSNKKNTNEVQKKGYQPNKIYGYHYVSDGFFCRICEKFFDKRQLSRAHLQSQEHYDLCTAFEANEEKKKAQISEVKVESSADLEPVNDESAPDADNSIAEPSEVDTDVQAESEGSECKRQKLSEDVEDATNTATLEEDLKSCINKAEPGDATGGEDNLELFSKSVELEGDNVSGISEFFLDDDINMILDESGLDLGGSEGEVKEDGVKPVAKARRGGRAVRGRKRK